mgnify:CR=1 FL=1
MAKINEIKSVLTGIANKPPVAVVDANKDDVVKTPLKKEATPVRSELSNFLNTLVEGKDYGYLPNVPKPVLLKQGALRILQFLRCTYTVALVDKTIIPTENLIAYTVSVTIVTAEGQQICQALGSTNSRESKFVKSGYSADNMLITMATKRALVSAVKEIINRQQR